MKSLQVIGVMVMAFMMWTAAPIPDALGRDPVIRAPTDPLKAEFERAVRSRGLQLEVRNLNRPWVKRRVQNFLRHAPTDITAGGGGTEYKCHHAACLCEGGSDCLDLIDKRGAQCKEFRCAGPPPICICIF